MSDLKITDDIIKSSFPVIWKYLETSDVTDLDFNCGNLWLSTVSKVPCRIEDADISKQMMQNFASLVAQSVGCNFNHNENTAYANTEDLRITCVHESQSRSGLSVCIRKHATGLRFTREQALERSFISEEELNFLDNAARANFSEFFCGYPGHGKTETLKLVASALPKYEKVVVIEDVGEINYPIINHGANCDELKVIDGNYKENIEKALRMNARRIIWGESRGSEITYLLESMSNGLPILSTLHMNDARYLADRMLNMLNDMRDSVRITNQIYASAGITILVKKVEEPDGNVRRFVDQICLYVRDEERNINEHILIAENGKIFKEKIPAKIREHIEQINGHDVFAAAVRR